MKIKLIIILFGISCLIFPSANLMEADAFAGPLSKLLRSLLKSGDDILKPILRQADDLDITAKVKGKPIPKKQADDILNKLVDQVQKNSESKSLEEEGILIYDQYHNEEYKYTINSPFFWTPYYGNIIFTDEELVADPELVDSFEEITIFTNTLSDENASGFVLAILPYFDIYDIDGFTLVEWIVKDLIEECNGNADATGYVCKNVKVLVGVYPATGASGVRPSAEIMYEEKSDVDSGVFETIYEKFTIVQGDDFVYLLEFGDTKDNFETYSIVYDEIEDSFLVDKPQDDFTTIIIVGIAGLGIIILFVARRLRNKTQELRYENPPGEWEQDDESR